MNLTLLAKAVLVYYAAVNAVLFISMALDKLFAVKDKRRIAESTLFIMSFLGGAAGGFAGMFAFHHKTKKPQFYIIYAISFVLHGALLYFIFTNFAFWAK